MRTINRTIAVLVAGLALGTTGCKEFLAVNNNPNAPDSTSANNYLAPMMHWLATSEAFDGRFIGRYSQMWIIPPTTQTGTPDNWARMGYDPTLDNAAQLYRDVYWSFGINLSNLINQSEAEQRWDLAGVGYILRAWGWLKLTDMHGEIIIKEAFKPDKFRFAFDNQEYAYQEIIRLLDKGIELLGRTDGTISPTYVAVGDKMFNGDVTRWTKFAWGLKAMALNHFSNKSTYDANAVIAAADKSFSSNAEEAVFFYPATDPTAANDQSFMSPERNNFNTYRQTAFVVGLMNGTAYTGAVDPRMSRMLAPDSTGTYRGISVNEGYGSVTRERPWNPYGYGGTANNAAGTVGKYLFDKRARFPVMTYAQLQFIKAEAALKKGDQATARQAYLNGIGAHIDFVNTRNTETGNTAATQISAAEKAAFLANPSIAPATITMSHIMGQKYIAQWAWAFVETWMDMRRYHYTDMDAASGTQVFRGFAFPTNYYPDNANKPVQRVRPRYNSDYVWNRESLAQIGGLALDYHTKPMWITER